MLQTQVAIVKECEVKVGKDTNAKDRLSVYRHGYTQRHHTAVLMTYMEERIGEIQIENNLKGFQRLHAYVEKCRQHYTPMYGLEDVTHYGRNLAIFLLERENTVKEVNSSLSYMERKSYATTKKSDTWDAQCISAVLMRRFERLPDANPQDYYWTMKQLVNRRDALAKTKSMLLRQFHDQIQYSYPSYKKFFHEIECNTSLTFYETYPSAGELEHTSVEELAEFLRIPSHNCCSTRKAEEILSRVEADAVKERDYQFGRDFIVRSIIRHLRYHCEELEKIETVLEKMLREKDYQLETLPGVHIVTACALVAHIGDIDRFRNANKLASYAGVAPICFSSAGKGKDLQNKSQGNRELYAVLYLLAMQQIQVNTKGQARNPIMRAYFESKISEGKTKIQALLCIMRRLVNIIYCMMKNKTAYHLPEITTVNLLTEKEQMIS
jgi:transposase